MSSSCCFTRDCHWTYAPYMRKYEGDANNLSATVEPLLSVMYEALADPAAEALIRDDSLPRLRQIVLALLQDLDRLLLDLPQRDRLAAEWVVADSLIPRLIGYRDALTRAGRQP